ncbi:hypothetical protein NPA08_00345 [Mycoplasmopsis citelli]|uniref:hypothetical protein n=1 Tax=Mycoplasmopsis citelli TaxID=171281 RepID=UPI0021148DE3|nr:hypothetical protein [Mycoplasmopsis citelli]UUD36278.1 hypothetical protein NPA08_00345 [Mycoplasmopsis citelli]
MNTILIQSQGTKNLAYVQEKVDFNVKDFLSKLDMEIKTLSIEEQKDYISKCGYLINYKFQDPNQGVLVFQILDLDYSYDNLTEIYYILDEEFDDTRSFSSFSENNLDIKAGCDWYDTLDKSLQEYGLQSKYAYLTNEILELQGDKNYYFLPDYDSPLKALSSTELINLIFTFMLNLKQQNQQFKE